MIGGVNPNSDLPALQQIASRAAQAQLAYAPDEDSFDILDPAANTFDLSANMLSIPNGNWIMLGRCGSVWKSEFRLGKNYLIMEDEDPERVLYLAIAQTVFAGFFSEEICQMVLRKKSINLIIFDSETEEIVQWID